MGFHEHLTRLYSDTLVYSRLITDTIGCFVFFPASLVADYDAKDVFLNASLMKMHPKIRRFILFN